MRGPLPSQLNQPDEDLRRTNIPPSTCELLFKLISPFTVVMPPATWALVSTISPFTLLTAPATCASARIVNEPLTLVTVSLTCAPVPTVIVPLTECKDSTVA